MSDVAAGWYDDGSGGKRWWDGRAWTTRQADMPKPATSYAPKPKLPEGTRWAAVGNPISKVGGGRYLLIADRLFVYLGDEARTLHEVAVGDIVELDVVQSTLQKTRGLATIRVAVSRDGQTDRLTLDDVKEFREGVAAITEAIAASRLALAGDGDVSGSGLGDGPGGGEADVRGHGGARAGDARGSERRGGEVSGTANAAERARDFIAELGALAAFHRDGVLNDEEFTAAKRLLLRL